MSALDINITDIGAADMHCPCGAVHLRITGEPVAQFYCHCEDCRAVSGGGYVHVALFPAQAVVQVQGATTTWTLRTMPRQRCAVCGTQVLAEVPGQDLYGVSGGLLPIAMRKPDFHIHCRDALLPVRDSLPHYVALPAFFGGSDAMLEW
ncbi:MAG: GFA family protein [Rhodanobacter sp.]